MRASIIISAVVAALVGFGGSLAVILAATEAVGATQAQTGSWVAALCISMMATSAILSIRHKMPIITAWSTPGAALIAASSGIGFEAAVGAFLFAAVLVLVTASFRVVAELIERIPAALASAMLAGVLFEFVVAIFEHAATVPALVLPLIAGFLILRLFSAMWAVLGVLALGIGLSFMLGMLEPVESLQISKLVWVTPAFDLPVMLGLGLPLYLVTMASQNLPGFAVLRASGYQAPTRSILGVTGIASVLSAFGGAHTSNLAAITASICTGPDTHPDPDKRWLTGPVYALTYAVLAVFGASLVGMFASFPPALVATVAGVALLGPFIGAASAGFGTKEHLFPAALTFVVTVSGVSVFGIGAAFWGLVAGLLALGLERLKR
ncbi:benzoate/H(+) symporter BenE family transporter [Neptunicoccus cionae]|uniref:benzoate/H(+) symporter BenE family transporter n=1 Tax=Neptunicoccus cionae TaxID=2035344 RepID=UPI000C78DA73|nr:benzoate/H(+) symporter BenE family transporter [Amylibacter cionae]PLS22816.1 benzoate transporter [Amylibacter cionae]